MPDRLRDYVRYLILNEEREGHGKGSSVIRGQNHSDLMQAIGWAQLHGIVKNAGRSRELESGQHSITVKHASSKNEFRDLIKSRFGTFIEVE